MKLIPRALLVPKKIRCFGYCEFNSKAFLYSAEAAVKSALTHQVIWTLHALRYDRCRKVGTGNSAGSSG
jgi:hypothetical protein